MTNDNPVNGMRRVCMGVSPPIGQTYPWKKQSTVGSFQKIPQGPRGLAELSRPAYVYQVLEAIMFDSLSEVVKHDDARATTPRGRVAKWVLVVVAAVVLFGGLSLAIQLLA